MTTRSLALIKSDVGREAGVSWLSSHPCPSLPHLVEPGRSTCRSPASQQMAPWKTRKTKAGLKRVRSLWGDSPRLQTQRWLGKQPAEASSPSSHDCSSSCFCFVFSFKPEIIWFCHVYFDLKIEMNDEEGQGKRRETVWTQKRKKHHSKDDTGHTHARTETPEVLALQTSTRKGRKQRQPQAEMCFAAAAV